MHQPCVEATHLQSLNRGLLTKRAEFAIQLPEQRQISPGQGWKHEEQT